MLKKNPRIILNFFKSRLESENQTNKLGSTFEGIPFNFHHLSEALAGSPVLVMETVSSWCGTDDYAFILGISRLVSIIFPHFPVELESELIKLVISGDEAKIHLVLSILRNFNGKASINNVCKEIVIILDENNQLLAELSAVMQSTGVVQGEFGQVNTFKQKIEDLSCWLEDKNSKVINFARKYISALEARIISEQRRAEEGIELRKHYYGDNENK